MKNQMIFDIRSQIQTLFDDQFERQSKSNEKKKDKYVPRYLEMIDFEQKSNPVSTYVHTPSGPLSLFKKNSTTENIQENEKSESTPI